MVQIIFKQSTGEEHKVNIDAGLSIMEAAIKHNIPDIAADCGGACACATCHIYMDDKYVGSVPEAEMAEEDMLDFAFDVLPNSRLSCQVLVQEAHEGMIIHLPKKQF